MKNLVLIRHGEAAPETNKTDDFERNLTEIGKQDSAKMAAVLLNSVPAPEIFVTSPAFRAIRTAEIFAATFGFDDVNPDPNIYEASAETLLKTVTQLSNDQDIACLIGHNPGISNLLYELTGEIITMATSSWVEIELNVDQWAEASADTGKLLRYRFPKST